MTMRRRYIVGSGWWCDDELDAPLEPGNRALYGDEKIRSSAFHHLWYYSVDKFTSPEKIIIVDSNSPVAPAINDNDKRIEFVSLAVNSGHAINAIHHLSGWTKSVLLGLQYAMFSEVEYFVYVEQDTLLKGGAIVEYCIDRMKKPWMFGSGMGTPQPLQQSFMIFDMRFASQFIANYLNIQKADRIVSPEQKFVIACNGFPKFLEWAALRFRDRKRRKVLKKFSNYDTLPMGYGRSRPINFDDKLFYFQHGNRQELERYCSLVGVPQDVVQKALG